MSRRSLRYLALVAALLLTLAACGGRAGSSPRFANVRKISFDDAEKHYILELARSHAVDGAKAPSGEPPKTVVRDEARGVFVTAPRPNQTALTAFAWGPSIRDAVAAAAATLKRLAKSEDLAKLPLRVDVIDETTDELTKAQKATWRFDVSKQGLLLATTPTIALLPQEIDDWGLIDRRGRLSATQFKKLAKIRGIGGATGMKCSTRRSCVTRCSRRFRSWKGRTARCGRCGAATASTISTRRPTICGDRSSPASSICAGA